jgi:hypothetical protein
MSFKLLLLAPDVDPSWPEKIRRAVKSSMRAPNPKPLMIASPPPFFTGEVREKESCLLD